MARRNFNPYNFEQFVKEEMAEIYSELKDKYIAFIGDDTLKVGDTVMTLRAGFGSSSGGDSLKIFEDCGDYFLGYNSNVDRNYIIEKSHWREDVMLEVVG